MAAIIRKNCTGCIRLQKLPSQPAKKPPVKLVASHTPIIIEMMRADLSVSDRSMMFNTDLVEALELDNMLTQASVSLRSAIGRTESRGAHAREDFAKRDDVNWLKHTLSWLDADGRVRLDYRPVHLQPLSKDVPSIPPKERVY